MRALKRRYGRAKIGSGKVRYFRVVVDRHGPTAIGYDARGKVVNSINGQWVDGDSVEGILREAHEHWPEAKNRTP